MDLDVNATSETWFTNKYIEDEIKKKVYKTRDQLASDEMEYDIRQSMYCLISYAISSLASFSLVLSTFSTSHLQYIYSETKFLMLKYHLNL